MPNGIEFRLAEIGNGSTEANGAISLNLENSYGQWTMLGHSGLGVVPR
jgi:hypothetical protein